MKALWVLAMLVALTQGKMDTRFCLAHTYTKNPDQTKVAPDGLMDYVLAAEITKEDFKNNVDFETIYLSVRSQLLMLDQKKPHLHHRTYAFPKTDTSLEIFTIAGASTECRASPLIESAVSKLYNMKPDPKTKILYMPGLDFLVPNTERTSPVFIRQEDVRGISCNRWHLCAYQAWMNATVSADFFYNTEDFRMPGSNDVVPVRMSKFIKNDDGTILKERYDYSFYTDTVDPKDKAFERPTYTYCINGVKANGMMPSPPAKFKFEAVSRNLGDLQRDPSPKPKLEYLQETYSYNDLIFSMVITSPGYHQLQSIRTRIVHDYTSGIEHVINLSTGKCTTGPITIGQVDFTKVGFTGVKMKSPADFFHINGGNYEYMGTHYSFDRGIDADVYTSVQWKKKNTIISTLWFATQDFLKDMGYEGKSFPLRFRQTTTSNSQTVETDVFKFSPDPRDEELYPDVTPCYAAKDKIYLTITLSGTYEGLYQVDPKTFRADFELALLKHAGVLSSLRMAKLRVQPADKGNTLVQFTLLDKPGQTGNSMEELPKLGLHLVWTKLKGAMDSGEFKVVIHNAFGTHTAKVVSYSKEYLDPTSFKGRTAKVTQLTSTTSSGFSPGAMGGLGVGMLLLGLILGFGSMKGVKKFRDSVPDINMTQLGQVKP